jgi:hypothetical protein
MKRKHLYLIVIIGIILTVGCIEVNNSDSKKSVKPDILDLKANPSSMIVGDSSVITVSARDVNGEKLSYFWWTSPANSGEWLTNITGDSVKWKAPLSIGVLQSKNYYVYVRVQNEHNKIATDSTRIIVNASNVPVVTITSPQNGDYIPLSAGIVNISAESSFSDIKSMKCYINDIFIDSTKDSKYYTKNWNITSETAGSKQILIIATRVSGYTGSATVTISIEGTIGKQKK